MHNNPIDEESNERPIDNPPIEDAPNPPNEENTGAPIDPTVENEVDDGKFRIPEDIPEEGIDEITRELLLTLPRGTRFYDRRTIVREVQTSKKHSFFLKKFHSIF